MNNFMSLRVAPKLGNEAFARSCVAAFATQLNPTIDEINEIKTAVSEAVTNCIVHAGLKDSDEIIIDVTLDLSSIHITVRDNGVGITDVVEARKPFFSTKPDDERTGMGFTIMDAYMDILDVKSDGIGVVVSMSKRIESKDDSVA